MTRLFNKRLLVALVAVSLSLAAAAPAGAAPEWRESTLPGDGPFGGLPLGEPSDLQCWAANRCLMMTAGNTAYSNGLFVYNGLKWRNYATVCGSMSAEHGRIVWAGANEFWTIAPPSAPLTSAVNVGLALCHFVNGEIVGSYSTKRTATSDKPSDDPYKEMFAGACKGPSDCWFGGAADETPTGERYGSFHLRWNGSTLKTVYAPATRGVSDIVPFGSGYSESLFSGPDGSTPPRDKPWTIPPYSPIQQIADQATGVEGFADGTLVPSPVAGLPGDVTEVLALDARGQGAGGQINGGGRIWAVGGGAASGPDSDAIDVGTPADRGPYVATRTVTGAWQELPMPAGLYAATPNTRFVDVAAIPGTDQAIAAIAPDNQGTLSGPTTIALLDASPGLPDAQRVQESTFANVGSVVKVECVAVSECWAATYDGRVFRYSDTLAPPLAVDVDPAFTTTVTFRPNEVSEQQIADAPPADDSLLFAPPPIVEVVQAEPTATRLKAAVRSVKSKLRGNTLILSFRVVRTARISVSAMRKRRVVARVRTRLLKPGRHSVKLRLNPKRWPTKLAMKVDEPGQKLDQDDQDTVTSARAGASTARSASCLAAIGTRKCIR